LFESFFQFFDAILHPSQEQRLKQVAAFIKKNNHIINKMSAGLYR